MNRLRVFVTSMGIISPVGRCIADTINFIKNPSPVLAPLTLFPTPDNNPLPAGEIKHVPCMDDVPRTHALALLAAQEVMEQADGAPDAVIIGVTTGGMPATEELLKSSVADPAKYAFHANGSVAEYLARQFQCPGPVITVSTACSSGSVAMKIALEMLSCGQAKRILAGGADALCRLTYYGFNSLQLVDPAGARPFDKDRRGMTVAEGAAMFFLTAADSPPDNAIAELLGIGISCDAYHPAAPHPEGTGALQAMEQALSEAGISATDIDYINVHGTGTIENDLAETKALHALFKDQPLPPVSSIKGAFGHSLGAAGAMGAVVSILSISQGIIPASTGFNIPDPALSLTPISTPLHKKVNIVLSNAFGFGGNNACLVVSHPKKAGNKKLKTKVAGQAGFMISGSSCSTGAGDLQETLSCINQGNSSRGMVPSSAIMSNLSEDAVRRLKRLSRIVLSLSISACKNASLVKPSAVFFGTAWGGLSETSDFLTRLFKSGERFTSPTDFIGSVHNAPAGQVAIRFKSTGPNVTVTGGDYSFEQALLSAGLMSRTSDEPILLIGADEYHEKFSSLFDASAALDSSHSDGGGALCLSPARAGSGIRIVSSFYACSYNNEHIIKNLITGLGGAERIREHFGAVFAGIPAAHRETGEKQLKAFLSAAGFTCPVIDYRKITGEFAAASAVAAVLAAQFVQAGALPGSLCKNDENHLHGKGILVLGFGSFVTAVEILPC